MLFTCLSISISGFSQSNADSLFKAGNWKEAIKAYEAKLKADPTNFPGQQWRKIGESYYHLKEWDNAIAAYKKAIAINGNTTIMYNLACTYARGMEKDSALAWLDQCAIGGFTQFESTPKDEDLQLIKDDSRFQPIIDKMKKNALPCSFQPESQQFNFWIGHWKVFNPQGQQAGTSVIEQILGECVIFENWADFFGNKGKSFNFYNSSDKIWQQTWVDDKGTSTEFINGKYENGAMRFSSSRPGIDPQTGKKIFRRLTFFNVSSTEVRQLGERSDDEGKTWQVEYDLKYIRGQ